MCGSLGNVAVIVVATPLSTSGVVTVFGPATTATLNVACESTCPVGDVNGKICIAS